MYTSIITIGRNYRGREGDQFKLSDADWTDFRSLTLDAARARLFEPVNGFQDEGQRAYLSDSHGQGFWDDEPEENYSVTVLHDLTLNPTQRRAFKAQLGKLARMFNQDAIAFIDAVEADLISR